MAEQNASRNDSSVDAGQLTDSEFQSLLANTPTTRMTSEELDHFQAITAAQDKRFKMRTVLSIWSKQQESERNLRRNTAYYILGALFIELTAGNLAFFCYLFGQINIQDPWIARTFFTGMYTQIIGIVLIVVKSLFPPPKTDSSEQLNKMVDKL